MAAPTIVQTSQNGTTTTNTTSHSITMPGGITNGNLLLCIFSCDGIVNATASSGWIKVARGTQGGTVTGVLFYKYATGSDSLTVTTDISEQSTHIVYELNNAAPPIVEITNGNSADADPPNNDTGTSREYLWIATHSSDSTTTASAAPSGYSGLLTQTATGAQGATTATAYKTATASSENPGTFTSASDQWVAATVALGPKDSYYLDILNGATGSNDNSAGSIAWSNPTNITAEDLTYATVTQSGTTATNYLKGLSFGGAVPTNGSILGVKVEVIKSRTGGTTGGVRDSVVSLVKAGSVVGSNKATSTLYKADTDDAFYYGGATDLWSTGLYPSDVNDANFGVVFSTQGSSAGTDRVGRVDGMRIFVYYTLPTANSGDMSTFYDDFDDNSIDTGKWTAANISSGTIAETGGKLVVTFPSSPATGGGSLVSKNNYTLVSNAAFVKLDSKPASGGDEATMKLTRDSSSYLAIGYDGTTDKIVCARAITTTGYSNVYNVAYDSTNHKWLRIREASGTIYWEASPTGLAGSWSTLYSETAPFTVTNLTVTLIAQDFVPVTGGATWDYFNVSPATATPLRRMMGYG